MEKDLTTGNITPHLYCFFSCIVYSLHLICSPNPDLNAGGFRDHSYDKTLFMGLSLHLCIIALQVRFVLLETASLLFIF